MRLAGWFVGAWITGGCAPGEIPQSPAHGADAGDARASMRARQWHLRELPASRSLHNPAQWVVAVLDTGVAYETATRDGVDYEGAPSLRASRVVAPADFVNDDDHANDDHQHGTHIASLIASDGSVQGVAPGVGLMPVKVLDDGNTGTEEALVRGIRHAVEHGAHVINMSLTLGSDPPSQSLLDALEDAHHQGVILVSASGNEGEARVTWPAASPWVLAVGASVRGADGEQTLASYSNHSAKLDVIAPGGDLTVDRDHDGFVDGLLAESIRRGEPESVSFWLMAGTSQAAAVTSGLAVHLLDDGLSPAQVYTTLRSGRVPGLLPCSE